MLSAIILSDASQISPHRLLEGDFLNEGIGCPDMAVAHRHIEGCPAVFIAAARARAPLHESNHRRSMSFGRGTVQGIWSARPGPPFSLFRGLRPPGRQGQALRMRFGRVPGVSPAFLRFAPCRPGDPPPPARGLDRRPPLIGAGLVRLHAQPLFRLGGKSQ